MTNLHRAARSGATGLMFAAATANAQQIEGTVRAIDYNNGWFTMDRNNTRYTVRMPYNPRTSDVNTFRGLRTGQYARLYGVYLNNSTIELRQFY